MSGHRLDAPPTSREIERRFRSPAVLASRPVILSTVELLGAAVCFKWTPVGLAHVERLEPPLIFAANHQSHADTPAIIGVLPRHLRERTVVAAALDVFGSKGNGNGMPSLKREALQVLVAAGWHAFAFDRHGPPLRSVRTAVELIRNGWSLLLYPEGTRSRTGELGPFKAGVGALARFTRRPVVPIHVQGGRRVLPAGAFLPRPGHMTVRFGTALQPQHREPLEGFAARLRQTIATMGNGAASIE